jgi:uncharacterized coiled-coil DUF342 family protein
MNFFGFSFVETARLDRIETQLKQLNKKAENILMKIAEYADAVGVIADQLIKALAEIQQELQNLDQVPQSAVDKLTKAQAAAQALDDLNPDQPPPPPPPQP